MKLSILVVIGFIGLAMAQVLLSWTGEGLLSRLILCVTLQCEIIVNVKALILLMIGFDNG
jgi:hypothetical protein